MHVEQAVLRWHSSASLDSEPGGAKTLEGLRAACGGSGKVGLNSDPSVLFSQHTPELQAAV
jgi:hypothetical protein